MDLPRRTIAVYCRHGLVTPATNERGYCFDGKSIKTLRAIEGLRSVCGDDLAGIKMILQLMNEVQRLNSEVHGRIGGFTFAFGILLIVLGFRMRRAAEALGTIRPRVT